MQINMSGKDIATATAALYVAADVFKADAVNMRAIGQERLAVQFEKQAQEAIVLALQLEDM